MGPGPFRSRGKHCLHSGNAKQVGSRGATGCRISVRWRSTFDRSNGRFHGRAWSFVWGRLIGDFRFVPRCRKRLQGRATESTLGGDLTDVPTWPGFVYAAFVTDVCTGDDRWLRCPDFSQNGFGHRRFPTIDKFKLCGHRNLGRNSCVTATGMCRVNSSTHYSTTWRIRNLPFGG